MKKNKLSIELSPFSMQILKERIKEYENNRVQTHKNGRILDSTGIKKQENGKSPVR